MEIQIKEARQVGMKAPGVWFLPRAILSAVASLLIQKATQDRMVSREQGT